MRPIHSKIDPDSERFAANFEANVGETLTLRERQQFAIDGGRRPRALDRAAPVARQDPGPRPDRHGDRRGHGVPRALDARRVGPVRRRGARRRHRHRHRRGARRAVHVHRQRRHREGRLAAADVDQEARAGPGHRPRERPRRDLPRRLRRRLPAAAGRDLPRQGSLRRLVLPPGPTVGGRSSPALGGARRLHRRRRLRAGAVRRGDHGRGHRSDLPRWSADREGGARRDHRARRPRRRRAPHPHVRRQRLPRPGPSTRPTASCARSARPPRNAASTSATVDRLDARGRAARPRHRRALRGDPADDRIPFDAIEIIARARRRLPVPRVQAATGASRSSPASPASTATSSASSPTTASSSPRRR